MIGIEDLVVDLELLFERYGLDNITEVGAEELSANCPFHDGDEGHHFAMNRESGLFNCFVCSSRGSVVQFVERMDNRGPVEAKRVLAELSVDEVGTLGLRISEGIAKLLAGRPGEDPSAYIPYEKGLHPYLEERGFIAETAEEFELGWSPYLGRVVIPAKSERGKMVGYILRAPDKFTKPKYLYTEGKWVGATLFGVHKCGSGEGRRSPALLVVEGSLDAMWLWQMGYDAVAILGSSASDRQVELISMFNDVVLMLDNDKVGLDATFGKGAVGDRLMKVGVGVRCVRYPEGRKDPQDCSPEDVELMLGDTRSLASLRMRQNELSRWRGESLSRSSSRIMRGG